jgi:hypothetical protein
MLAPPFFRRSGRFASLDPPTSYEAVARREHQSREAAGGLPGGGAVTRVAVSFNLHTPSAPGPEAAVGRPAFPIRKRLRGAMPTLRLWRWASRLAFGVGTHAQADQRRLLDHGPAAVGARAGLVAGRKHVRLHARGHLVRQGVVALRQQTRVQRFHDLADPEGVEGVKRPGVHPRPVVYRHGSFLPIHCGDYTCGLPPGGRQSPQSRRGLASGEGVGSVSAAETAPAPFVLSMTTGSGCESSCRWSSLSSMMGSSFPASYPAGAGNDKARPFAASDRTAGGAGFLARLTRSQGSCRAGGAPGRP